uniref:RING-type domain-containing protein n=1 Tax=Davidia involucrata TaxID=16924 RepID=A0A5B7AZR7_DAVIN
MVGSEDTDAMDDANGDKASSLSLACSICLDLVTDNGDRSRAKLQCGHEFHLDCIGSAFNVKGAMQCPNCRKIERGRWLYASGCGSSHSFPNFTMDNWTPDEEPYESSYSEMPFRVHWCPFSGLTRVHSSFEEVESPSTTYHDLQGHHAIFTEHTAPSSVAHSYVEYFGPIPPASSNSNESVDDPNFNHRWNGLSGHNEIFTPHAFAAIDIPYQSRGQHSPPFSVNSSHINGADQASVPPTTLRSTRGESDAVRRSGSFMHPFLHGHGSAPRGGSSFFSSIVHPGSNSRSHERIQVSHAIHHQQQPGMPSPIIPGVRRFNGPRGLPPVVPVASRSDPSGGFFVFPSSGRNLHDTENPLPYRFHPWERDHLSNFPVVSFDRDLGWGLFHHATSGSDSSNRSGRFWQWHWS